MVFTNYILMNLEPIGDVIKYVKEKTHFYNIIDVYIADDDTSEFIVIILKPLVFSH